MGGKDTFGDIFVGAAGLTLLFVYLGIMSLGIILRIIATIRVSRMGGSGVLYFFFGWLYIACSSKADTWDGFEKIIGVLLGLFTYIGLDIYAIVVLKPNQIKDTHQQ